MKKRWPIFAPGVDFNAGQKSGHLGDQTRQQGDLRRVKRVRNPVQKNRMEARIAKEDLKDALRGRVFTENGFDLFANEGKHILTADNAVRGRRLRTSVRRRSRPVR